MVKIGIVGVGTVGEAVIKNLENAFIVKDDIEIGSNEIIPLWVFGFMY